MHRFKTSAVLLLVLLGSTLSATALNHEPYQKFEIEQDGASCKPAIPSTQGITLDRHFEVGDEAGWVHCTIAQQAAHYAGRALDDVMVSEMFIKYFLPPAPPSPIPTDIGGWSAGPSKTTEYKSASPSELDLTVDEGSVYGCSMEGRAPYREYYSNHGATELIFYHQEMEMLPSHVLCYLPAHTIIESLTWSYTITNDH